MTGYKINEEDRKTGKEEEALMQTFETGRLLD
jgi:hypothetical protein